MSDKSIHQMQKHYIIFTDGACSGNPGPGGWGSVILSPEQQVIELGGGDPSTTNNRMEMGAAIGALQALAGLEGDIQVFTDSTYLIRGITKWIWGWRKRGWKTADGAAVQNQDLWEQLAVLVTARKNLGSKIDWYYVRGHTGNPGNERCDRIAVAFSAGDSVALYRGPVKGYFIDLLQLPEIQELPEMKPAGEKKVAHSYLSNIGGIVYRHRDWGSCERRVKGQSGAKFKKAMSPSQESEILKSWGLSESTAIKND